MRKSKKGQAALHVVLFMVSLFVVGLLYVMFSPAFRSIMDNWIPTLDAEDQPTAEQVNEMWWAWPIGVLVLFLLELFVKVLRGPGSGYPGG